MLEREYITRHICPRNCYDTCAILATVKNGKIVNITGDPAHGYTHGKLCAKGYSYLRRLYSPDRIKQPLRQRGRNTGSWYPVTWDEALEIICEKILHLKTKYGSTLPICLNKYSGNFGLLNTAIEGLFNRLGPTTQAFGSPCWSAGLDAQYFDFGNNYNSDPENLGQAELIILWGVNPAWTAVHSLPYIHQAQRRGTKVIVIDPFYSETAKKADIFIQVRPGQDGCLALALAKIIANKGREDKVFLERFTHGWAEYKEYLEGLDLKEMSQKCGVSLKVIDRLADLLIDNKPAFIWMGFGIQRYTNGGQNIRAIDALGALTGNIGRSGGGVHYANLSIWNLFQMNFQKQEHKNRLLNINKFASELERTQDPPVKMLWIANRNLFRQDTNLATLTRLSKDIELIVSIELFMTESTKYADLILPTTTIFEEIDIVPGYWHHWIALNEQAIKPLYQSKSDLEIAMMVSRRLNELKPGSSTFPWDKSPEAFLDEEFDDRAYRLIGIDHWSALKESPVKIKIPDVSWEDRLFETPSGKFEFYSDRAEREGYPGLPIIREPLSPLELYPFRLISPHSQHSLNSQFSNVDWIKTIYNEPTVSMNPANARDKNIYSGSLVRIFNQHGEISLKALVTNSVPPDVLVSHQGSANQELIINKLLGGELTDMGSIVTGNSGLAIFDTFVDIELEEKR